MIFAVHCLFSKSHFMSFLFQLTYGSFLLMPRGPTAVALLPSNVKPYFRRDFFSSRVHFHQGRLSPVSPSPVRHGGLVCRFLQSLLRLSRMGEIDCLFYLFFVLLARCYFGHISLFISHFTSFVAQHASFTPISHGGERLSR